MITSPKARARVMEELLKLVAERLQYLFGRWQDEGQYEDFNTYVESFGQVLPKICKIVSASKRPFAFRIRQEGFPFDVKIFCNSRQYGWKTCQPSTLTK